MAQQVEIIFSYRILFTCYLRVWLERMAVIIITKLFKKECHAPYKIVLCRKTWQRKKKVWLIIYWVRFYYHD